MQLCLVKTMKSDPRLNWSFDSSIPYSGLSRYLLSSSVDFPDCIGVNCSYSSRRNRVRRVDSPDRLVVVNASALEIVFEFELVGCFIDQQPC